MNIYPMSGDNFGIIDSGLDKKAQTELAPEVVDNMLQREVDEDPNVTSIDEASLKMKVDTSIDNMLDTIMSETQTELSQIGPFIVQSLLERGVSL